MKWLKIVGLGLAIILILGLVGSLSYYGGARTQAYTPSPWGYFGVSGGGISPSETIGGTDGAAIEFTGAAATTLWMGSFDLSDDVDESFEWSAWLPSDYLSGGAISELYFYWVTDDTDVAATIQLEIQAKAVGDGDLISIAYSSPIESSGFTSAGANKMNIETFSGSLTPSNSPVKRDALILRFLIDESESTVNTTVYFNLVGFRYPRAQ